jgi:DNA primase
VLTRLDDPFRRQQYVPLVADLAGVTTGSVSLELERMTSPPGGTTASAPRPKASETRVPPAQQVEREALKLLVRFPDLRASRLPTLDPNRFSTVTLRRVVEFLLETPASADVARLTAMAEERSESLGSIVSSLALEPLKVGETPSGDAVEAVFLRLEEFDLKRQAEQLRKEIQPLNPLKDRETYEALFKRLIALEGERRRLREGAEGLESGDSDL